MRSWHTHCKQTSRNLTRFQDSLSCFPTLSTQRLHPLICPNNAPIHRDNIGDQQTRFCTLRLSLAPTPSSLVRTKNKTQRIRRLPSSHARPSSLSSMTITPRRRVSSYSHRLLHILRLGLHSAFYDNQPANTSRRCFYSVASYASSCPTHSPPTKCTSDSIAIKRHNGFQKRDVSRESPSRRCSQWLLLCF